MTIEISGAKNLVLPLLASTILSRNSYIISNFSINNDVLSQLNILSQFGVKYKYDKSCSSITIDSSNLRVPDSIDFTEKARANYYFIGSSLLYNRISNFIISNGCNIDERNIDFHLKLLNLLGKNFKLNHNELFIDKNKIVSNQTLELFLPKPSVGATVNALLMFCKGSNTLALKNYAKDPYIFEQIAFLKTLGANIQITDKELVISGTNLIENETIVFDIMPDPIEALSYIIFSAISLLKNKDNISKFVIGPINTCHLGLALDKLKEIGIHLIESYNKDYFHISIDNKLKPFNIMTDYFPGIYTDSQPFFALLASFIEGRSEIKDTVYSQRFAYINDYKQYGIDIYLKDNTAIINGKHPNKYKRILNHKQIYLKDLRSGASTFFLNKLFDDQHKLNNTKYIDRGYVDYDYKSDQVIYGLDIIKDHSIAQLSNIKIGGRAKFYIEVASPEDLERVVLFATKHKYSFRVIGSGCNVYFSDYYDGIIIKNNIKFCNVISNNNQVIVNIGSGNLLQDLVDEATNNRVNIHQWSDIPGSIGGSIYGNAGAYGKEIKDHLVSALVYDVSELKFKRVIKSELNLQYRNSNIKSGVCNFIIIGGEFCFDKSQLEPKQIMELNKKISLIRRQKMPYNNTLGCVFKNIDPSIKTGTLLDSLELKGKTINGITISDNHSNIWSNTGSCSSQQLDNLINNIQDQIQKLYNLKLRLEIEKI